MISEKESRRRRSLLRSRMTAVIFMGLLLCFTLVAYAGTEYTVDIDADGRTLRLSTSQEDVDIILRQAGIELSPEDKINAEAFVPGGNADEGNLIKVLRPAPVKIIDGDREYTVIAAGQVKDALKKANVTCRASDSMNCGSDEWLDDVDVIRIKRAFSVDVRADGKTVTVDFLEGKVSDLLKKLNIKLDGDDEVSPSLDRQLRPGDSINVYRVEYKERSAVETVSFKTEVRTSSSLYRGSVQVEREGKNGKRSVKYRDKIVDGRHVSSSLIEEKILKPVQNRIEVRGTKIRVLSSSSPISSLAMPSRYKLSDGIPLSSLAVISGRSTAYTAPAGAGTASGVACRTGYVAVDPRRIPYGTEMYVVSTDGRFVYGYCIAADTGGFVRSGNAVIDVYMDTRDECYQWGSREVCIYILRWGNGRV